MTGEDIKKEILETFSAVTFKYHGKNCGVDPFSMKSFCLWFGDEDKYTNSIEETMTVKFFDGKSLNEIAQIIEIN